MLFLEPGNLDGLFVIILLIMAGPALIMFIIAVVLMLKDKKKTAKIFWILGFAYLIISFGICGAMMMS